MNLLFYQISAKPYNPLNQQIEDRNILFLSTLRFCKQGQINPSHLSFSENEYKLLHLT